MYNISKAIITTNFGQLICLLKIKNNRNVYINNYKIIGNQNKLKLLNELQYLY